MQLISVLNNGKVEEMNEMEHGEISIEILSSDSLLYKGLSNKEVVWMDHHDHVSILPTGFIKTSKSANCSITSIENRSRNIYGVQFHPEELRTKNGEKMLHNFAYEICLNNKK